MLTHLSFGREQLIYESRLINSCIPHFEMDANKAAEYNRIGN